MSEALVDETPAPFRDGVALLRNTGLLLHPLEPRGKKPVLKDWPNLATSDPKTLDSWAEQFPYNNIGAVLGLQPNGWTYFVLDLDVIDPENNGNQSLEEHRIARGIPMMQPTLVQRTGGGGLQLFYYCDGKLAIPNRVGVLAGVDVRGDGGQVALPPSIHPSGITYAWMNQERIAEAPGWILDLVGAYERGKPRPSSANGPKLPKDELTRIMLEEGAPVGQRDDLFTRYAWSLARTPGLSFDEAKYLVRIAWQKARQEGDDPFTEDDAVQKLVTAWKKVDSEHGHLTREQLQWAQNIDSPDTPEGNGVPVDTTIDEDLSKLNPRNTDRYNGLEFAKVYTGLLVYVKELDKGRDWLVWDGKRWRQDNLLHHQRLAANLVNLLADQLGKGGDDDLLGKRIHRLESTSGLNGALTFAAPRMVRSLSDFDSDPWLINFQNGTLNLKTRELQPHRQGDYLTRMCTVDYDPEARDPVWDNFIATVLPDPQKRYTFQAFMGSCLTGSTADKAILVPYGQTDTGKSTATEPCLRVLGLVEEGGYGATWDSSVVERGGQVNLDEKRNLVRAARMIVVGELTKGSRFNDGFIKQFSGGDTVNARALYKGTYSYRPQAKLVMHTNFVPRSADRATQNRLKLLPFEHRFTVRDEGIKQYLESDPSAQLAIAAWMVEGCWLWQDSGLGKMPWLDAALHEYDLDSNPVAAFISDTLEGTANPQEQAPCTEVWRLFQSYAAENNLRAWGRRAFEAAMRERGLKQITVGRVGYWEGVRIQGAPHVGV